MAGDYMRDFMGSNSNIAKLLRVDGQKDYAGNRTYSNTSSALANSSTNDSKATDYRYGVKSREEAKQELNNNVQSDRDNQSQYIDTYKNTIMEQTRAYMKTPEYREMMKQHNQSILDKAGVSSKEEYYASDAHQQRRAQAQADSAAHKARQAKLKAGATHHEANGLVNEYM